jgi:hypothetical protein
MPDVTTTRRLIQSLAAAPFAIAISWATPTLSQPQPAAAKAAAPAASAGIATADHEISGIEVTLVELKRTSGDTITARWRYHNNNATAQKLTTAYGGTDPWKLAADTYLLDPINKKKYLVLLDSKNVPIAAKHGGSVQAISVGPGATLSTWAKYPAPPENVKKVSLYINGVAPFEDILIGP